MRKTQESEHYTERSLPRPIYLTKYLGELKDEDDWVEPVTLYVHRIIPQWYWYMGEYE